MGLSKALRMAPLLALLALATAFLVAPAFAATTYTVSVQTDAPSYSAAQTIMISGTVSPAPGANTAVVVTIKNPANAVVDIGDDPVNPSTGAYNQVTVAGGPISCGGSPCWIAGTYTVNATWGGYSGTASKTTTFTYSPTATTTTTSTSTTSTTSTSSTSTSKTTSSSSSTTTTLPPTTTSSSTTVSPSVSSSTSSTTTTLPESSGGGLGSLTYVIIAAVAIVVVGIGIVMWRRKVASDFSRKSTAP